MFNTLKYAKMLQKAGFSREQSEASVHILVEVMEDKLASKQDLKDVELALRHDMKELGTSLRHEMKELHNKIDHVKSDMIIKMGAMQAAAVGLVVALIKLL